MIDNGTLDLQENDYKNILSEISLMKELINIQDIKNIKFNFDYDYFHKI